jgi:hypothetical protein
MSADRRPPIRLRPLRLCGLAALLALLTLPFAGARPTRAQRGFEEVGYVGGPFRAVAERDGLAYVASGDALLIATAEQLAAGTYTARFTPGGAVVSDVALTGDLALLAAGADGLVIVDVSTPAEPRILSSMALGEFFASVTADGDTAYVAANYGGLVVVDIADPAWPRRLAAAPTRYPASRVVVRGGFAFVVEGGHGLEIFDVHDREAPGAVSMHSATLQDVAVGPTHAFLATTFGLEVLDVRDPANPVVDLAPDGPALRAVALAGDVLWAVRGQPGWVPELVAMDVTVPGEPADLGLVRLWSSGVMPADYYWWPWARLAVAGAHAWLAAGIADMWLADVARPDQPAIVDSPTTVVQGTQLTLSESLAFAANADASLRVIDIADASRPRVPGRYQWLADDPTCDRPCGRSATAHGYTYLTTDAGIEVLDLTSPAAPRRVALVAETALASDLAIRGDYAFVVGTGSGLVVLDLTQPASPTVVADLALPIAWYQYWPLPNYVSPSTPQRIILDAGIAYISSGRAGVAAVSVAEPRAPRLLSSLPIPNAWAVGVAAANGQVWTGSRVWQDYAGTPPGQTPPTWRGPSLWAIGALDPASPCLAGSYDDYIPESELPDLGATGALVVRGQTAFLSLGRRGLAAVDLTDPAAMTAVGWWQPDGASVTDVAAAGDLLYVLTAGYTGSGWPAGLAPTGGLHILRWQNPPSTRAAGLAPAAIRLRQALPFHVYLSGLQLQRCQ